MNLYRNVFGVSSNQDNVYTVAQKFLSDNELPPVYLDQVIDFIQKNTQGQTINTSVSVSEWGLKI
jgi:spore coat polysaccharide biosynthesis protein SpsF (cytidylyltransferase family)